jgi:hypothetical protein
MKTFHYPKGNIAKQVLTVGELLDALSRFPRDMPVLAEWEGQYMPLGARMITVPYGCGVPDESCECLIVDAEMDV